MKLPDLDVRRPRERLPQTEVGVLMWVAADRQKLQQKRNEMDRQIEDAKSSSPEQSRVPTTLQNSWTARQSPRKGPRGRKIGQGMHKDSENQNLV